MVTKPKEEVVALGLPQLQESVSSFTGEDVRIPRLEVPTISVSYKDEDDTLKAEGEKKGEFVQYEPVTKTRTALGKSITIQILHHRQSLSSYSETEMFYTPEVSMKAKELALFCKSVGPDGKGKSRFVTKGEMKKLREQFPDLGYRRTLYVLHDGQLKSLVIKGASFGKFLDLTKELKGASSASCKLELSTEKGKKGTVTYYAIVFTPKEKTDMAVLEPTLRELSEWFAKHDQLQEDNQKAKAEEAAIARGDGPVVTMTAAPSTPAGIASELFDEPKPITDDELTNAGL